MFFGSLHKELLCEKMLGDWVRDSGWVEMPQLKYWQTVYDMEMLLLRLVRSIRTGDLFLYEKSWDEIADSRDTMNVRVKYPDPYRQFADGFVTIAKTQNPFSMIGFVQNHEQQNKELKMHGGTLNLSDECLHRVGCGGTGHCPGHHGV